jgi:hypothetical protein
MRNKFSLARLKPKMRTSMAHIGISGVSLFILLIAVFIASCSKDIVKDQSPIPPSANSEVALTAPSDLADTVVLNPVISVTFKSGTTAEAMAATKINLKTGSTMVPGTVTLSGMMVSFTPASDLMPETHYTATVGRMMKDGSVGGSNDYSWSFRTGRHRRNNAPTVVSVFPLSNATSVAVDVQPKVKFSEEMMSSSINTTTFTLKQGTTAVAGTVSRDDEYATFKPSAPLSSGTLYTATITTGVKDEHGTSMENNYVWSFTTAGGVTTTDVNPPTVLSSVPANNATGVAVSVKPAVTFSEAMDASTITTTTITLKQGTTVVAGTVALSGNTATITPSATLLPGAVYTGTVSGVKDAVGNALATAYSWSFTTAAAAPSDVTPPTVSSAVPANNATGVAVSAKPAVTFSEAMDAATITSTTFTLKQGTNSVAGTVAYSGTTATFTPSSALAANTVYTGTISTGAKDAAGNAIANAYTWSFTTAAAADVTPPTVLSSVPANNATGIATSTKPSVTFSEAMTASTITTTTFTLKQGTTSISGTVALSGNTATFTPSSALAASTLYTGTITTGAKDAAGNALAGAYNFSFTTAAPVDATPPTVSSVTPANSATGVVTSTKVTANFSEAMTATTITTSTFTLKQGTTNVAGTVTYSGTTATFTPSVALSAGVVYTATITTGAKDAAGNAITADYSWSFTTAPAVALVSFSTQVWPILQAKCMPCHSGSSPSGGISITNYSTVSALSNSQLDNSSMYGKLGVTSAEQTLIKTWISQGKLNN